MAFHKTTAALSDAVAIPREMEHTMTEENTTPDELTPEQAEADLARLEQAVVDGEPISPEQITTARERISFAQLVAKGKAARAEAARRREEDELRARTKEEVAENFFGNTPTLAFDRAVEALEFLIKAVESNNDEIDEAGKLFDRGGVKPLGWDHDPTGVDLSNYAAVAHGNVITSITVDGRIHRREKPDAWAIAAFRKVVQAHDLRKAGGGHLDLGDGNLPLALQNRDGA